MAEPDMEGEGKARRNLVLASSLVVLGAWLDVPLVDVADKVLGIKHAGIESWRAWVAVLALLAYLGHRYTYSEEASSARERWRIEYAEQRTASVVRLVRSPKSLRAPFSHFPSFLDWLAAYEKTTGIEPTQGRGLLVNTEERSLTIKERPWAGLLRVVVTWPALGAREQCSVAHECEYLVSRRGVRAAIAWRALAVLLLRSKSTSGAGVPAALALAASGVAGYSMAAACPWPRATAAWLAALLM